MPPSNQNLLEYMEILHQMKLSSKKKSLLGKDSANSLELLSKMRMLVSRAKTSLLPAILIEMLTEDNTPLVVFVNFRESGTLLRDGLTEGDVNGKLKRKINCHVLTGDVIRHAVWE